jgi:hypothetical protein
MNMPLAVPVCPHTQVRYRRVLGGRPEDNLPRERLVLVETRLKELGSIYHWSQAPVTAKPYMHFACQLDDPKNPVNVQLYGDRSNIQSLHRGDTPVICQLELVRKVMSEPDKADRHYILVNLFLDLDMRVAHATHEFSIRKAAISEARNEFLYTTMDMRGVAILVRPLPDQLVRL